MLDEFSRTRLLLGGEAIDKLKGSAVAIFGVGGVGSFVAEALARSGVGRIILCDNDEVALTNLNRQLIALHSTIGRKKADVMRERILDINPAAKVEVYETFYGQDTAGIFDYSSYSYIVDAIDTVSSKLLLVDKAEEFCVPIISSMGAGNKLDPTAFEICDIYKTSICPLARVMRRELKKRGIRKLKVVYSREEALKPQQDENNEEITSKRQTPGSVAFVPSVAGLIIAGEVIKDIIK